MNTTKQLISIQIAADASCPWCLIGYSRLREAMEINADKYEFQLSYTPYLIGPFLEDKGLGFQEFSTLKGWDIDYPKFKSINDNIREIAKSLTYNFDFTESTPDIKMYNTLKVHRVADYILNKYGKEKQVQFFQYVSRKYFEEKVRPDVYNNEVIVEFAGEIGFDRKEISDFLNDESAKPTQQEIKDLAQSTKESRELKVVPTYIINDKFKFNGAEGPHTFTQWFQEVAQNKQE